MRLHLLFMSCAVALAAAGNDHPVPRFSDSDRRSKLEKAFPEVDRTFEEFAKARRIPGMVWGIVIDGQLAHVRATGVRDTSSKERVGPDTVFRIASMTKSFTALAILKLRDEGKLSLEDPVSKWIPEFEKMEMPTRDAGPIRVRHLLTHGAGFPEDNPWGDQQLGVEDEQLTAWLRQGIPFSTAPDSTYEYSNYGFALLGRIVAKSSGESYEAFLKQRILDPLRMKATTLHSNAVPGGMRAVGYRMLPDGSYQEEPSLPHGAFGAMGGLLTSAKDLGRYVAFQLSAWPPRDEAENGPVKRSSVREMNNMSRPSALSASHKNNRVQAETSGYGYGLRVSKDCRFGQVVGHGGGLPGFGSYMAWLPEYGVGMFAMANLTYAAPAPAISEGWDVLMKTGALQKRELPVAPILFQTRQAVLGLWQEWRDEDVKRIAAMNLLLDISADRRREEMAKLKAVVGSCSGAGPLIPVNWLRGRFELQCEKADVAVAFTLAPTQPPRVQYLAFQQKPKGATSSPASDRPLGVSCTD